MKRYPVIFSKEAIDDLSSSIEWGCENWGEENTWAWFRTLQDKILNNLSLNPRGYPIAPDSEEYEIEVRQMNFDRYRILFHIGKAEVTILHLKGPYTGKRKNERNR